MRPPARSRRVMKEIGDSLLEPVPDGKPGERRIRDEQWPDPGFVDIGIRGDLAELDGSRVTRSWRRSPAPSASDASSTWSAT